MLRALLNRRRGGAQRALAGDAGPARSPRERDVETVAAPREPDDHLAGTARRADEGIPPRQAPEQHRRQALRSAFTPTRPQHSARRFMGRRAQQARILQAVEDDRAHIVLYAERGRGKTSLANMVAEAARGSGLLVARYTCSAESDFDAIMRGLADGLLRERQAQRRDAPDAPAEILPPGPLAPGEVVAIPERLGVEGGILFIVDEFDRVLDPATSTRLADTLKQIADRGAWLCFMIVGVSDTLEQLLGHHPSIQRTVVGVPLPLLTDADIEELLVSGGREAGLEFPPRIRACIAALARGVPYFAQLLALRAGQAALERGATAVMGRDLREAIERTLAEADPRIVTVYQSLTDDERFRPMTSLLRAIAAGTQNEFGQFRARATAKGGTEVAGASADPATWSRLLDTGAVRRCGGADSELFAFNETTLAQYVLLRTVSLLMREDPGAGPAQGRGEARR